MLDLKERFDTAFADADTEPAHRDVTDRITAGRRVIRRQRAAVVVGCASVVGVVGAASHLGVGVLGGQPDGVAGSVTSSPATPTALDSDGVIDRAENAPFQVGPAGTIEVNPAYQVIAIDDDVVPLDPSADRAVIAELVTPDGDHIYAFFQTGPDFSGGSSDDIDAAPTVRAWYAAMRASYREADETRIHKYMMISPGSKSQVAALVMLGLRLEDRVLEPSPDGLAETEIVEQRQVDLGERAGDGDEVVALVRAATGESRFVAITFDGNESYWTLKRPTGFADLDAFEAWAREKYESNERVR